MLLESNMDYYKNKSPASPNGNEVYSESSSDEDGDKIRVGKDYQAVVPEMIPVAERNSEEYLDKALLVWSPTYQITDQKVDEYINLAKDKYGYNGEQALGMLFWHKHDLQQAINDLANFTPFPEEWSLDDKALFEQAFQFHGKNFHRIKQMLPEKSISALVKYYYSWKKMKSRTSLMDRQARKLAIIRSTNISEEGTVTSDRASEVGSNTDSESDDKKWIIHRGIRRECNSPPNPSHCNSGENSKEKDTSSSCHKQNNLCVNCGVLCSEMHNTSRGHMCRTCALHFRRTGNPRPTMGPARGRVDRHFNLPRNKRTPPRGMYINHDDLTSIASGSTAQSDFILKSMDRELLTLKRIVQNNKQSISALKSKTIPSIEAYKSIAVTANHRINSQWSNDELLLAVQGIRNFGKDFQAIADIIGTKTKAHVKTFYVNNRKRYNLDLLLQDHEKEYASLTEANDSASGRTKLEKLDMDNMSSSDSDAAPISNTPSHSPLGTLNNNNNTNKAHTVVAAK